MHTKYHEKNPEKKINKRVAICITIYKCNNEYLFLLSSYIYIYIYILGWALLPKVLEEISPMPNPIPIPMNVSPSEKKSNFLHV